MVDEPNLLSPGSLFQDRYEVLEEIGAGSFGRVYKARQTSTGQAVAIKLLRPHVDDRTEGSGVSRARFQREMEVCAALSHPHIVGLIDSGTLDDGRLYAVFQFVPGLTLRELLERDGPLETAEAVRLMSQILDALSCAHIHGVIHRDLKPENIMVTETGARRNALVLDFGLGGFTSTEVFNQSERLTATREMMGTPCYAAPEQLRGEPPTEGSDLYSWGLVLLECLTGELALSGATAYEVLAEQLSKDPVPIPAWLFHEGLGHVLEHVTGKDAERRVTSASEVLAELDETTTRAGRGTRAVAGARTTGQRRQLTLLTIRATVQRADGDAIDLDDLDEILQEHRERVTALVEQQGGIVVEGTAERHVVMFGYPRAMENDARRAVRAALRLATVTEQVGITLEKRGLSFWMTAGLHSDLVLVRERPGSSGGTDHEVVGSAPDVAARLAGQAAPGQVLASAETEHLLHGEMECEPAPRLDEPHASRPIDVVRVVAERLPSLVGRAVGVHEGPLIERATEFGQLKAQWQRATRGMPSSLLLVGEAGIGKSRLLRELRRTVPVPSWFECRCVPESAGSPLRPIVGLLRAIGDSLEEILTRYGFDLNATLPLFATLLDVPLPEGFEPLRLAPERQKELTIEHLVTLLVRVADTHPLAFVIEDLHWADPTTLEMLTRLVDDLASAEAEAAVEPLRILFLATARPEFVPPWSATHAGVVRLGRLSTEGVGTLVQSLLPTTESTVDDLVEQVVARTDGVPLFVEEVIHAIGTGSPAGAAGPMVPSTVRELLTTRLDALSPKARATVQLAATLGREFAWDVLQTASERDESQLRRDIREVMDADLLHQRRGTASEHYLFRHALLCEAAYESMARPTREGLHRRIADAITSSFPEVVGQQPELVAHHLEAGRALADAVPYWQRAADRAMRRAAYPEATGALERALASLAKLPASAKRTSQEIEALTALGTVQFSTQGYAASDVEQTFARAQELCVEADTASSPKILSGIIGVHITRGNREATQALLPQFTRMAESPRDTIDAVTGWTALSIDAFWRGAHAQAREYLDHARPAYRTDEFQRYAREYGYDGGIFSYAYTVWNEWILGRTRSAESVYDELLTLGESSFDPYSLPLALCYGMALAHWRRDAAETRARAEELVARSSDQKLYLWLAVGMCGLGGAALLEGNAADGIPQIKEGLNLSKSIGDMASYSVYLTYLAAAHEALGEIDKGVAVADEGLGLCTHALGRFHEPELLRLKGVLLQRRGDLPEAEHVLRRSVAAAREHGAVAWQLRGTNSLVAMLGEAGRGGEGETLAGEALSGLPEDIDIAEVTETRALAGLA